MDRLLFLCSIFPSPVVSGQTKAASFAPASVPIISPRRSTIEFNRTSTRELKTYCSQAVRTCHRIPIGNHSIPSAVIHSAHDSFTLHLRCAVWIPAGVDTSIRPFARKMLPPHRCTVGSYFRCQVLLCSFPRFREHSRSWVTKRKKNRKNRF